MHGYLADSKIFYNQIPYFEREFEVFAPDFKGFGENKGMAYPYSLDDYILDLKEYFYKNSIKSPSVVAHSFGGRVAIKCAYLDNNFFDKIVLTGSAGLKPKKTIKKVIKKGVFNILKRVVPKEKLKTFYSKDYLSLDSVMQKSFIKIVNEHLDYCLNKIENKTLIINGIDDKETPVYMAKRLNLEIKNSNLILLSNAGHFAFIDKPNLFNMEIGKFLLS